LHRAGLYDGGIVLEVKSTIDPTPQHIDTDHPLVPVLQGRPKPNDVLADFSEVEVRDDVRVALVIEIRVDEVVGD